MTITILYPQDPFNPKEVDDTFKEEYLKVKEYLPTILINTDDFTQVKPYNNINNKVIYRGWMLSPSQYEQLEKNCQGKLITTVEQYLSSHYLPNWYPILEKWTPQSIITDENNVINKYEQSQWNKAFIKDYVKSLKTGKGSIINNKEDIKRAINDMKHYRGHIEGGVVLREVHDFVSSTEMRFFVLNGQVYSPGETTSSQEELLKNIVNQLSNRFFYSIDLIKDISGKDWLVEIGDGQVSDCVGWDVKKFAMMFDSLNYEIGNKIKP